MTTVGGELWAKERCPDWHRYCAESYPAVIRGRTIMSAKFVSPSICDHFMMYWPQDPIRTKIVTINDNGLIGWRSFGKLHIGLASYFDSSQQTADEFGTWTQNWSAYYKRVEPERSWWRTVQELQKFVNP